MENAEKKRNTSYNQFLNFNLRNLQNKNIVVEIFPRTFPFRIAKLHILIAIL